jgi:cobalt-zinc-cadmium efflux system protein
LQSGWGQRPAAKKRAVGYGFKILPAKMNATVLILVAVCIHYEAWIRLRAPAAVQSSRMLIVAYPAGFHKGPASGRWS